MRQAIEEEFILDVLKNYTTYETYFQLLKAVRGRSERRAQEGRPGVGALHEAAPAQHRAEDRDHGGAFPAFTRHKIGGRAKAMVVTGSRLEAVRYKQSFDKYIKEKGYADQDARGLLRHGGGRQARGRDLHRGER